MSDTLRLFIALPLDSRLQQQAMAEFRSLGLGQCLKLVADEQLHLTLKFWSHFPLADLANLLLVLSTVASRRPMLSFNFNQPLVLGGKNPRVLALRSEDNEQVGELFHDLEESLVAAGIADRESRVFRPHLTLARVKSFLPSAELKRFQSWQPKITAVCDELVLFSSTLTPAGPEYDQMANYSLKQQ